MPKTSKEGTGITRRTVTKFDMCNPKDWDAADKASEGYIFPPHDFPAWLEQYEAKLAERARAQRLPERGNSCIIFDADNRNDWYEPGADEWQRIASDPAARRAHRYGCPRPQVAMDYLSDRKATGWQWGIQSVRWYLGTLMQLVLQCRSALAREAWLELAGRCYELGRTEREFTLKFSGDKRLQDFERHVAASNSGNRTRKAKAAAWKAEARRIAAAYPAIDLDNAAGAAREILAAWSRAGDKPSERSLRAYLPMLAKRAVLPEMIGSA